MGSPYLFFSRTPFEHFASGGGAPAAPRVHVRGAQHLQYARRRSVPRSLCVHPSITFFLLPVSESAACMRSARGSRLLLLQFGVRY